MATLHSKRKRTPSSALRREKGRGALAQAAAGKEIRLERILTPSPPHRNWGESGRKKKLTGHIQKTDLNHTFLKVAAEGKPGLYMIAEL